MKCWGKRFISVLMVLAVLAGTLLVSFDSKAAEIVVRNGENLSGAVYVGDTGRLYPDLNTADYTYYYNSLEDATSTDAISIDSIDKSDFIIIYRSNRSGVLDVDNQGNYSALSAGQATLDVYVYPDFYYYYYDEYIFHASVTLSVIYDMTNVTLSTYDVSAYLFPDYYYEKNKPRYNGCETAIPIVSPFVIENLYPGAFSYSCDNPDLKISVRISDNVLYIDQSADKSGKANISVTICGKTFNITYKVAKTGISCQSKLLPKKKKFKLKITGYSGPITWRSTNPKVATVDSNGVVKGKKIGNCVIIAKMGDEYLGCAVSVTKPKLVKVCERATYIGTHWKYSQPLRTKKGYYDCSALVWKAYSQKAGLYFGSVGYPGTTVTESAWCKAHGKMIKGGMTYKKFQKMQVNPGDILFKSTNMKDKFNSTYHVEMFTGYICNSVDSSGKPEFSALWAARGSYYSWEEGSLLARPMK